MAYNPDGQLTSYTDCSGKTTQWKYNALGQLAKLINAAGEVTEYQYEAGQLVLLIHPDKTTERFERDAEGRLLSNTGSAPMEFLIIGIARDMAAKSALLTQPRPPRK